MKLFETEPYKIIETTLCFKVIGMTEREAVSLIERNERVPFIEARDKQRFEHFDASWCSHRINLTIKRGRVTNTHIG